LSQRLVQAVLSVAALAFGIHLGAAIYETVVITPLWAAAPPQSVRGFNPVAEFAVHPLSYKIPAVSVLAVVSLALMLIAISTRIHYWMLLAGGIGTLIAAGTILHAIPLLRELVVSHGEGLTDAQIVTQVEAWLLWSRIRIAGLLVAWAATLAGLLSPQELRRHRFRSELRWK
jgi:hypothetical protein